MSKIYTKVGDDGTTGLLYGGRVRKDDPGPMAYGDVDEAQSFIGLARAETPRGGELDHLLIQLERDLWVLMAELATEPENHHKLVDGKSRVTMDMVAHLEQLIDEITPKFPPITEFVVPGQSRLSAQLDVARTVVRRAERTSMQAAVADSFALPYLNRLSDLLWTLARWQEGETLRTRSVQVTD
jgi:cob(I)alamin adenosyltransferase